MMPRGGSRSGRFGGPLWVSGFRPFFLLGSAYGIVALGLALPSFAGGNDFVQLGGSGGLWHGHEMVFGFAVAIICGLLLTALPSWAGVPEQVGGRLAFLAGTWVAGRLAVGFAPFLTPLLVAATDAATLVALTAMLTPGLAAASDKRFLVVLPVLLALAATNLAFHWQLVAGTPAGASHASDAAVATIAVLFSLTGGFMTPVFTRNALHEAGSAVRVREHPWVELAAHASVVAFALAIAVAPPPSVVAGIAVLACIAHALRLIGWRGWAVRSVALVFAMHVGYAWLVVALALAAAAALGLGVAPRVWIHAFTIGAVGTMMLALMPRVSLRHTGRPLVSSPAMTVAYAVISIAALLRLGVATSWWGAWAIVGAAALWALCFAAYLAVYGPLLVRASLPRAPVGAEHVQ